MSFGSPFRASGSDRMYGLQASSQLEGLRAESEALRRLEEKKKRDRIASEKPDAFKSLVANVGRGVTAYYTLGQSETSGLGKKGSQAIVGKRSDGSAYDDPMGEMIEVGAGAYNMMEGMKQKDISNLKAEDIAAYNRDIAYAKSFAEGSPERKQALMAARTTLETTQTGQDYGDRADTNPFLYTRGRKDVEIPTKYFEGDKAGLPETDPDIKTDAEQKGETEAAIRRLAIAEAQRGPRPEALAKGGFEKREEDTKRYLEQQEKDLLDSRAARLKTVEDQGLSPEELIKGGRAKQMSTRMIDERLAEKLLGYDPALEKTTTKFKGSPMSKTYLEKAAKDESTSRLDKMSDEKHRVSEVKKAKDTNKNKVIEFLAEKGLLPSSARDPLLVEDELIRKRQLKRQHERFGTPDMPKPLIKSDLRKRMDKLRKEQGLIQEALSKKGGILSGDGSPGFASAYPTSDEALLSRAK